MWNAYAKWDRLEKAFHMRGLNPGCFSLDRLVKVMEKRGITDAELNPAVWTMIRLLEPPGCSKSHCEAHSSRSPMNCAKGKTPGRCKGFKGYLERKAGRKQKDEQAFLDNAREVAKQGINTLQAWERDWRGRWSYEEKRLVRSNADELLEIATNSNTSQERDT